MRIGQFALDKILEVCRLDCVAKNEEEREVKPLGHAGLYPRVGRRYCRCGNERSCEGRSCQDVSKNWPQV